MDLVTTVINKVSNREDADPTDLPPLYEAVDPGALQSLIESSQEKGTTVKFAYHGYDVAVSGNGNVVVEERTAPPLQVTGSDTNEAT